MKNHKNQGHLNQNDANEKNSMNKQNSSCSPSDKSCQQGQKTSQSKPNNFGKNQTTSYDRSKQEQGHSSEKKMSSGSAHDQYKQPSYDNAKKKENKMCREDEDCKPKKR